MLPRRYAKISCFSLAVYSIWFLYISFFAKDVHPKEQSVDPLVSNTVLWGTLVSYAVFMLLHTLGIWASYPADAKPDIANVRGARQVLFAQWIATLSLGLWGVLYFDEDPSYYGAGVAIGCTHTFLLWGGVLTSRYTATFLRGLPSILWLAAWVSVAIPALITAEILTDKVSDV